MYYIFSGLLALSFLAGMMTWKGCSKQEVQVEVRHTRDTVAVNDTVLVEVPMYRTITEKKIVTDTSGFSARVNAAVAAELAALQSEGNDIDDVVAEGFVETGDYALTMRYWMKAHFFEHDLTVYKTDTLRTAVPETSFAADVYKYGFWALLGIAVSALIFSLTQ